jgi:ribosomal protein L37AE/L43A
VNPHCHRCGKRRRLMYLVRGAWLCMPCRRIVLSKEKEMV